MTEKNIFAKAVMNSFFTNYPPRGAAQLTSPGWFMGC